MARNDAAVWSALLSQGDFKGYKLSYDVDIGGAGAAALPPDALYQTMWESLRKKRLDCVATAAGVTLLIEVKPVAGFSMLGQLLGYQWLWNKERGVEDAPRLIAACLDVDPDLNDLFPVYGIELVQVQEPQRSAVWQALLTPRRPSGKP